MYVELKHRAVGHGVSLTEFLRSQLAHLALEPEPEPAGPLTLGEPRERIRRRPRVELKTPIEDMIREDRESH